MSKYFDYIDQLDEQFFNALRDKHVPACGKADTVAGEVIRAMDRVIYRYWNDGDMVFHGYGNETCNSSFRYLARTIGKYCPEFNCATDANYEHALALLAGGVMTFLEENAWAFTAPNEDDSRTPSEDDLAAAREEDEFEEDEEYSIF